MEKTVPVEIPPSDKKFCIVSMDGATPRGGGFVTAVILQRLYKELQIRHLNLPHDISDSDFATVMNKDENLKGAAPFLSNPDVFYFFAGTSSGGWSSLYLASCPNPDLALIPGPNSLLAFWRRATDAMSPRNSSSAKIVAALAGQSCFSGNENLIKLFQEVFGNKKLRDLYHNVVITSILLDNQDTKRRWAPRIFKNFGDGNDCDESIVDVAMRTAAAPIFLPIYQSQSQTGPGYLDGGLFANNPAMCAVSELVGYFHLLNKIAPEANIPDTPCIVRTQLLNINERIASNIFDTARNSSGPIESVIDSFNYNIPTAYNRLAFRIQNIRLLSIGNGMATQFIDVSDRSVSDEWGYQKWLFDLSTPGLILDLAWSIGEDSVDRQCELLFGQYANQNLYRRIQPYLIKNMDALDSKMSNEFISELSENDALDERIEEALNWLFECAWINQAQPNQHSIWDDARLREQPSGFEWPKPVANSANVGPELDEFRWLKAVLNEPIENDPSKLSPDSFQNELKNLRARVTLRNRIIAAMQSFVNNFVDAADFNFEGRSLGELFGEISNLDDQAKNGKLRREDDESKVQRKIFLELENFLNTQIVK
jgi:uncharacterized protein